MSSGLIGGVVGAVVGFVAGGPTGAQWGWAIGSAIGATFAPTEKVEQQKLTDLKFTGTEYGEVIPYLQGHLRIAPQIWWASDRRPIATITESEGKGGGGGTETISYTYDVDLLLGLTDNEIAGIARIWDNGKLVYTALTSADPGSLIASQNTDLWDRLTVYTGTATQLPDPTYEAAVGAGNVPAYRHRSYAFIEGFHLGSSGIMRNLTFEVATKATLGEIVTATRLYHFNNALTESVSGSGALAAGLHGSCALTAAEMKFGIGALGESSLKGQWYVDVDDAGTGHFNYGTGDFTLDIQIYWNVFPDGVVTGGSDNRSYAVIFAGGDLAGGTSGISLDTNGKYTLLLSSSGLGDELIWQHRDTSGITRTMTCDNPFDLGEWTHVAVVRLGTTLHVTVGGVSVMSMVVGATDSLTAGGAPELLICGTSAGNRSYQLSGYVDEFRVVDGAAGWPAVPFEPPSAEYTGSDLSGDTITLQEEDLDDVVSRLCIRSGLSSGQIDVTALASITRQVRGMARSQVEAERQPLELLASSFYFEATVSDKIYFIPRGGASAATIPFVDLGAAYGNATAREDDEPFALKFASEIEAPAQIAASYINVDDDYQTGTEMSDRLESALDDSVANVTMALGLTADEAKGNANTMMWDQIASGGRAKIAVLGHYAKLEPTDVITVVDVSGTSHRVRIVTRTDTWPLLEFEIVKDDASVLQDQGITSLDYTPSTVVSAASDTVMELIDGPILRNADDNPGFYGVTKGSDTPYPGSIIMQSNDDTEFKRVATVTESGVFGDCTTTLGNWTGPHVFDEVNSVTVDVGNGTLASSTRAALIADESVNAMLIGSEVIQFVTATLVSPGVYTLTRLRRGGRGTEWAMTGHSSSERCVLLRTAGMRRIDMRIDELGDEKFYRGVTIGRRLSTATSESFTNNAIGLKPFSPTNLRAFQDVGSGDITITCLLRSRLTTRGISTLGQNIPLGEDSAAAELDIADIGDTATILRTLTGTITGTNTGRTTTFTYTAAQQASDSTTHGSIYYRAYQLSETVSRGYALEKAA